MRLKAVIELQQAELDISSIETEAVAANVSNLPTSDSDGFKGFQLSENDDEVVSTLDGTYKFYSNEGYPGWLSDAISNVEGYFTPTIRWLVTFESPVDHFYIRFDSEAEEYASEVRVNGQTYYNDSTLLPVTLPKTASATIEIVRWNKPYKSAKIVSIDDDQTLVFEGSEIEDVQCSEQAWASSFKLSTGFIQQYADITFRDVRKRLMALADSGKLTDFMPIDLFIQEDSVWIDLGTYISDSWDVDRTTSKVSVSCNDYTRIFDNVIVDIIAENISVADQLTMLSAQIPEVEIIPKPDSYVVNPKTGATISMQEYLASCIDKDVYFQQVSATEYVSQLCDRWMLLLYWHPTLKKYVVMEAW